MSGPFVHVFSHIFASAMRQSTRSGPTAQRAARAAAVAKRTPVASPPPAATATVAGGNANAPGGAGKAAATSVAPGGVPALLGSPEYLAGFPELGSPAAAAADATAPAGARGRTAPAKAAKGRSAKAGHDVHTPAKATKSGSGDGYGLAEADSTASTVVVSPAGGPGPGVDPGAAPASKARRGDELEASQLRRTVAVTADAEPTPALASDKSACSAASAGTASWPSSRPKASVADAPTSTRTRCALAARSN